MVVAVLMLGGCSKKSDCCSGKPTSVVTERRKDAVCGMWVEKSDKAIKAEWDNADYYFCAEKCKADFLKNPTQYATKCDCKSYKRDCKCEHCSGGRVRCDCK